MPLNDHNLTSRAVAYLKGVVPNDDPAPALVLSFDDSPVLRKMKNGLAVSYVVDQGNELVYVQNRHLACDQIDHNALHSIGLANLESHAAQGVRVVPHPDGHVFAVLFDGNFEASLILLDSLWEESFRQFVTGRYAVAVPARDILAFCDASSPSGIAELQQVVSRLKTAGDDHRICDELFVRMNGEWQVLTA